MQHPAFPTATRGSEKEAASFHATRHTNMYIYTSLYMSIFKVYIHARSGSAIHYMC